MKKDEDFSRLDWARRRPPRREETRRNSIQFLSLRFFALFAVDFAFVS
jgi:hypothetical protein